MSYDSRCKICNSCPKCGLNHRLAIEEMLLLGEPKTKIISAFPCLNLTNHNLWRHQRNHMGAFSQILESVKKEIADRTVDEIVKLPEYLPEPIATQVKESTQSVVQQFDFVQNILRHINYLDELIYSKDTEKRLIAHLTNSKVHLLVLLLKIVGTAGTQPARERIVL